MKHGRMIEMNQESPGRKKSLHVYDIIPTSSLRITGPQPRFPLHTSTRQVKGTGNVPPHLVTQVWLVKKTVGE